IPRYSLSVARAFLVILLYTTLRALNINFFCILCRLLLTTTHELSRLPSLTVEALNSPFYHAHHTPSPGYRPEPPIVPSVMPT
ncbi:hypothetical protein F5888DRAFT_1729266, partial [Russula emetica]